jgi:hypothetical protein
MLTTDVFEGFTEREESNTELNILRWILEEMTLSKQHIGRDLNVSHVTVLKILHKWIPFRR